MPHDEDGTPSITCTRCGTDLTAEQLESGLCAVCAMSLADSRMVEPAASTATPDDLGHRPAAWRIALVIAIVGFAAALVWASPRFLALAEADRPLRVGVTQTDRATDRCIENLWTAVANVQNEGAVPDSLVCPAADATYVVTASDDRTVISCPDPTLHDLRVLEVSTTDGVPRAER